MAASSVTPTAVGNAGAPPPHRAYMSRSGAAHLEYLTGPRAELFRALVKQGYCTPEGEITLSDSALPTLAFKERAHIAHYCSSMKELFAAFRAQFKPRSTHLIGGAVTYLLFSQTDYPERVFKSLGLPYNPALFPKRTKMPPDIDVRMQMPTPDMDAMREWVIAYLAREEKTTPAEVFENRFSELCTIRDPFLMQLISLNKSPVDWILCTMLPRTCVFTRDALQIPIGDPAQMTPEAADGKTLRAFFDCVLGFARADHPESIDAKGWWRYIDGVMKGFCSVQLGLEERLRDKATLDEAELRTWLAKHHPNDPVAALVYTLNVWVHTGEPFLEVIRELELPPELAPIQRMLCKEEVSFDALIATLKLAAFAAYVRGDVERVEMRSEAFERPVMHLKLGGHVLQLDVELTAELPRGGANLFAHICPPLKQVSESDSPFFEEHERFFHTLLESETPLERYLGARLLFSAPRVDKRAIACRTLLAVKEVDRAALPEFEAWIGQGVVPPLDAPDFERAWMEQLFVIGQSAVALPIWRAHPRTVDDYALIERLPPPVGRELFNAMPHNRFPERAWQCALATGFLTTEDLMPKRPPRRERQQVSRQLCALVERRALYDLARRAFERGFFVGAELRKVSRLLLEHAFTPAALKQALKHGGVSGQEALTDLLRVEEYDCDLFPHLVQLAGHAQGEQREVVAIRLVEVYAIEGARVAGVMRALEGLIDAIPPRLHGALFEGAHKRGIRLSSAFHPLLPPVLEASADLELIDALGRSYGYNDVVRLKLADAWKESRAERAFQLLKECQPCARYYEILAVCGGGNLAELPALLDRAGYDPLVLDLALDYLTSERPLAERAKWLAETHFFDTVTDRAPFREVVGRLTRDVRKDLSAREAWLLKLIVRYTADLKENLDQGEWGEIWEYFDDSGAKCDDALAFYRALEAQEIACEVVYASVLRALITHKNRKILQFADDLEGHLTRTKYMQPPLLRFFAHAYLLEGIATLAPNHRAQLEPVRALHATARAITAPTIDEKLYASIDFNLVECLLKGGEREEAQRMLAKYFASEQSPEYWKCAGALVPLLVEYALIDETVTLLGEKTIGMCFTIDLPATVTFLLKHGRAILAARLLIIYIQREAVRVDKRLWDVVPRLLQSLEAAGETNMIRSMVLFVSNHFIYLKEQLGMQKFLEAIEICMTQMARHPDESPMCAQALREQTEQIIAFICDRKQRVHGKERLLAPVREAIITLSRLNWEAFNDMCNLYMAKIALPVADRSAECYRERKALIDMMVAARTADHPYGDKLACLTSWMIIQLIECPEFKGMEGQDALLEPLREGLIITSEIEWGTFDGLANAYMHLVPEFEEQKAFIEAEIEATSVRHLHHEELCKLTAAHNRMLMQQHKERGAEILPLLQAAHAAAAEVRRPL